MKNLTSTLLLAGSLILGATNGYTDDGKILTNASGMTLYTFAQDSNGSSACYDACAEKWPPYIVGENVHSKAGWGKTSRKDGSQQWTFNGQPLYTWNGDVKVGDTNGDGIGGVWYTVKKEVKVSKQSNAYKSAYDY